MKIEEKIRRKNTYIHKVGEQLSAALIMVMNRNGKMCNGDKYHISLSLMRSLRLILLGVFFRTRSLSLFSLYFLFFRPAYLYLILRHFYWRLSIPYKHYNIYICMEVFFADFFPILFYRLSLFISQWVVVVVFVSLCSSHRLNEQELGYKIKAESKWIKWDGWLNEWLKNEMRYDTRIGDNCRQLQLIMLVTKHFTHSSK